ncbi:MAG: prepilin peptidase [Candidatus Diapherotrites archaeon]
MFYLVAFSISIIGLIIATYTDFKERIISNKLNYAMLFSGFILQGVMSYYYNDYMILGTAVVVTILTFFGSYLLWKIGVWAGGDVKLMTALAALNPINPNLLYNLGFQIPLFKSIALPIFPLSLFIFSVFAMLPYGALLTVNAVHKKTEMRTEIIKDIKEKMKVSIEATLGLVGISSIIAFFGVHWLVLLPTMFLFYKMSGFVRKVVAFLVFGVAFYNNGISAVYSAVILYILIVFVYAMIKFYFYSKKALEKEITLDKLEEGDIPAETMLFNNGKVIKKPQIEIKTIIKYFKDNNLEGLKEYMNPKGREVISARKARGVTDGEIIELKKLQKGGLLENKMRIKMSAPFVPAVLIGYVMLNIVGDLIWNLIL